ncbi:MAG: serine hydrolase [Lachnospiraceae bacterium]|nr:serine hydrolase [Lachnospiraceae bacterium]
MLKKVLILMLAMLLLAVSACEQGQPTKSSSSPSGSASAAPTSARPSDASNPASPTGSSEDPTETEPTDAAYPTLSPGDPKEAGNCSDLITDSKAFAVVDDDGKLFLGKNMYEPLAPASITKVLTALVTAESVSLDNRVVVPEEAVTEHLGVMSSGVRPSFKPGETLTVRDLLYALILPSTNSAGNILAFHVAGSVEAFVQMMNEKVAELGLTHSHFMNPHGLDEDGHLTCAYDMAVILRAAVKNDNLRKILGALSYTIPATEYAPARQLYNNDGLVNQSVPLAGVYAGKPGSTNLAKGTLVTAIQRNGKHFYVCTLCSDEGYSGTDTCNITEYAYARLNGTKVSLKPILYDLSIVSEDESGATIRYKTAYRIVSARIVYWNVARGTGSAVFRNSAPADAVNDVRLSISEKGFYHVQVFYTDQNGKEEALQGEFLFDGKLNPAGRVDWNGHAYILDERGFVRTGGVETTEGCYYTNSSGALLSGFVGQFYAGKDYKLVTGWITNGDQRYFYQADGRMATGKLIIDGVLYTFSDNGVLQE